MGTVLLGLAAVAGLACAVHMLWRMRRGEGACCAPSSSREEDAAALAERQAVLADQLAAVKAPAPGGSASLAGYAVRR
jgi:hypothetical protein